MEKATRQLSFTIESYASVRSRKYLRGITIEATSLSPAGWMHALISAVEERAALRPEPVSDIAMFRDALRLVVSSQECLELLNLPPAKVGRIEIRNLFGLFETLLMRSDWRTSIKYRAGTYFRKYVLDFADTASFAEEITRKTLRFKTQMYISSLPRSALSDIPLRTGSTRAPLGAMPHSSLKDLYSKSYERVEFDLQRIIQACVEELKFWRSIRQFLLDTTKDVYDLDEIQLCRAVRHVGSKRDLQRFALLSSRRQLGLYSLALASEQLTRADSAKAKFPGITRLLAEELNVGAKELRGVTARQVLFLPHRMHSLELISNFLLLLCFTGWNSHSLVNMTADQISLLDRAATMADGPLSIQGFKSRTDDETPVVVLDSTHPYAVYALNLLLWNNRQLKSLGFIDSAEKRLWFSYSNTFSGLRSQQYIGFQNALQAFIERHGLPNFSFDQIRPQRLIAEQLKSNNLDSVRDLAGHVDITTTGRYQDQELFRRLNSSINLEFQRRLEATVRYRLRDGGVALSMDIDDSRVDVDLLIPLGDGASCSKPEVPPLMAYLDGDICNGKACHQGEGCSNRRIVIDQSRIEELIRKRSYYLENWARLLDENPEAFHQLHAGRILFSMGLYDFIKNGPHNRVLAAIEKRLEVNDE